MQWDNDIDLGVRQYTARLVIIRALARGWRVAGFESNPAILFLYPNADSKPVKIFSALPPTTSYIATKIAKDKHITTQLLVQAGLPVAAELFIDTRFELPSQELADFLTKYSQVVVKPLDAAHGKGITIAITKMEKLLPAIERAQQASHAHKVLVQEQLHGHDVRIVTMGYAFLDAMNRVPPFVVGDGSQTVGQLILLENQHHDRGQSYKSKLTVIPFGKAEEFLGASELDRVPLAGEQVQVIGISNIGTGGSRINLKNRLPSFLVDMAIRASEVMNLPVCGVDFIVARQPQPDSTPSDLQAKVIEVNACPSLTHHEDLESPGQIQAIDKYLDYLQSTN